MSSYNTRVAVRDFLTANWATTPWFDLSDYVSFDDIPNPTADAFLLVQFIGGSEDLVTLSRRADGYREDGLIYLHYVIPTGFAYLPHMQNMETLRTLFRNRRLGDLVFENVDPFTDQAGQAIEIDGPYHGFSSNVFYYQDLVTP